MIPILISLYVTGAVVIGALDRMETPGEDDVRELSPWRDTFTLALLWPLWFALSVGLVAMVFFGGKDEVEW